MKRIIILLTAVLMMSASVPVFAADMMDKEQKDQCLLASKNCRTETDSINQKIAKLNTEIKKGTKVYSPEEINKLKDKLKEVNDLLDNLLKN